jgi:hypothetical protein
MSGSQSFRGSFMIPVTTLIMYQQCDVCRKAGPDIAGKTKFVSVKKFKCKSLVFLNKSLKHENVPKVQQKPIPQLSIFCLIQGINNYV